MKVYTEWNIPPERERPELVASGADVRAALDKGRRVQLLDARAAAQFSGVAPVGFSIFIAVGWFFTFFCWRFCVRPVPNAVPVEYQVCDMHGGKPSEQEGVSRLGSRLGAARAWYVSRRWHRPPLLRWCQRRGGRVCGVRRRTHLLLAIIS